MAVSYFGYLGISPYSSLVMLGVGLYYLGILDFWGVCECTVAINCDFPYGGMWFPNPAKHALLQSDSSHFDISLYVPLFNLKK